MRPLPDIFYNFIHLQLYSLFSLLLVIISHYLGNTYPLIVRYLIQVITYNYQLFLYIIDWMVDIHGGINYSNR
ncbi:CPXV130 protein [Cowpox virus]|uniref:CPXV130 protein n=2 Tax=Orthopoxvirus TaxID=10242 RepID=U5TDL0_COWPX|nr:CMP114.5R [Camelpox virus CMS]AGY97867.1 CPXV130 protein [Cowpox virus]UEC93208.1 CPXV130 protein [Camelpox virus]AGY98292.1 CPXV130 protein [Cowpox virus]AGY98945.1 CPXV130 protein [Cowpox virus]